MKWLFVFLGLMVFTQLQAQEKAALDWDIDSIFDEPAPESPPEEPKTSTADVTLIDKLIKQQNFIFDASYEFSAGIMPGWLEPPWSSVGDHGHFVDRAIKMSSSFAMYAQIDNTLRVSTTIAFKIPNFGFTLRNFFFDYNYGDVVFLRGGKYSHSWGISPNYNFTNLLARVPNGGASGESFIFKIDVPTGIGGFQVLALTRANLMGPRVLLKKEDFGYGGKYNLALRWVDLDLGIFYQDGMAMRTFLSIKTTLGKTELYTEGLIAIDVDEPSNVSGAASLGFIRDFFVDKFNVNGEVFYNAEKDIYFYRPETNIREAGVSPFIEDLNMALNLRYKFGGKGDFRLFAQTRYAPFENSAQLIPGFTLNPFPHIELYTAVPMSLGSKEGYYYKNTYMVDLLNRPIPFCVVLLVSIKGSIQVGHTN